ncbi:MAG TPA: sigma-70 family RNA polymerase sigma factor [Phycisphaerae bacterium]|nr:sigma-70 family RNA polymerase sigma factor [Phycisphaerae bacterium]
MLAMLVDAGNGVGCVEARVPESDDEARADRAALERLRAGDLGGFDGFVDRYKQRLFRYLLARVESVQTAEDLTQDVFLKAIRNPPGDAGAGRVSTWLFTVAQRCLQDHQRWRRRRAQHAEAVMAARPAGRSVDPAAAASAEEERVRLAALLGKLPEEQRDVLTLRLLGDLSIAEIAAVTGAPEATVKSRLKYGLEKLARSVPGALKEDRR